MSTLCELKSILMYFMFFRAFGTSESDAYIHTYIHTYIHAYIPTSEHIALLGNKVTIMYPSWTANKCQ